MDFAQFNFYQILPWRVLHCWLLSVVLIFVSQNKDQDTSGSCVTETGNCPGFAGSWLQNPTAQTDGNCEVLRSNTQSYPILWCQQLEEILLIALRVCYLAPFSCDKFRIELRIKHQWPWDCCQSITLSEKHFPMCKETRSCPFGGKCGSDKKSMCG